MDRNLEVIHRRNILLLKIIAVCFGLDVAINLVIDRLILLVIVPVTATIILIISLLVYFKVWIRKTMYIIIVSVYTPFVFLIESEPLIINYIFFWTSLLLSSIYQKAKPVIVSSCIANLLTIYYFFKYKEIIFTGLTTDSVVYIIGFNLFITIILLFSGRFFENELWSKNEFLYSYFNNTSDAIVICALNGAILNVNESFEKLTGYNAIEIKNKKVTIIEKQYLDQFIKNVKEMKKTKCSKTIETVISCKDDKHCNVIVTITPIKNRFNKITNYICIGKDITKLKMTEEALRRTEMLSVVGQLAAGVAHEIKNPVTVLSGFVQLMKQKDEGNSNQFYHEIMQSELNRILTITNEFLVLGKQQTFEFVEKKIQSLLKEVVLLLKAEAEKHQVNLNVITSENIPPISCNPNQLKQVFINMIKNSIEAMPNGGEIMINVCRSTNNKVMIEIADKGCGMSKETLAKVGTPFYTTKENGTGLGMMVSHKIIESHNGKVDIESEINVGTKIKIQLPIKECV
ncbi:ATP-binding protein [Schinkia sp. CFF1]